MVRVTLGFTLTRTLPLTLPNPNPNPNPNPRPTRGAVLHPSAIEAATSAMEVVALAGANTARLVVAHINGRA